MTVDINEFNEKKTSDVKVCETCKCLTCRNGKMFNDGRCPKGVNCTMCNGKEPRQECEDFKSGF